MGTSYSLDPDEYRAAADVIEGYGSTQADHGSALAAGTSTPLSSSGSGIGGAISMIAQGTVQKIVTDVTSTTKGFADDTAQGLRTQAAGADQLESDIAGHAKTLLSSGELSLPGGGVAGGGFSLGAGSLLSANAAGGGMSTSFGAPLTSGTALGQGSVESGEVDELGLSRSGSAGAAARAAAAGQEESQQAATQPFEQMRGARSGGGGAGAAEERGQRPGYLKDKTEVSQGQDKRMKEAVDKHVKACGMAPIPFGSSRLVCAKCGSIIELGDADSLSA